MPSLENIKSLSGTGLGRPRQLVPRTRKANAFKFADDGETPNNPRCPFILYRSPVDLTGAADPASLFEVLFAANGWKPSWRDAIYPYNHFHTGKHEVLGVARGHARVRFGGKKGRTMVVKAGDVIIHPAGVGHCRISSTKNFLAVGAYPPGGRYDELRPGEIDHTKAKENIRRVPLPKSDPVYGKKGPLLDLWRKR
jgi:uncharacterized protein YjlB